MTLALKRSVCAQIHTLSDYESECYDSIIYSHALWLSIRHHVQDAFWYSICMLFEASQHNWVQRVYESVRKHETFLHDQFQHFDAVCDQPSDMKRSSEYLKKLLRKLKRASRDFAFLQQSSDRLKTQLEDNIPPIAHRQDEWVNITRDSIPRQEHIRIFYHGKTLAEIAHIFHTALQNNMIR